MNSFILYRDGLDNHQIVANWIYNYVISNNTKNIGLLSNKQYNAVLVLSIVREMISANKPELFKYNRKLDIVLNNGCRVTTGNISTATSSLRGRTIDVLLFDNFNLYKTELVKDFFYCYMPVMAYKPYAVVGFVLNTEETLSQRHINFINAV